jgi:single-stranded-DNA-specific exonuclease
MMDAIEAGERFRAWLRSLPGRDTAIHVLTDSDADGLPAAALLVRGLRAAGYAQVTAEVRGKFETAWSPEVTERLRARAPGALIVADMGVRAEAVLAGVPTLLIDHHRPTGVPAEAVISAYREMGDGEDAKTIATTGLLAYWCVAALVGEETASAWLWLAGISLLSDLGDKAPFPELAAAKKRFGGGALRDATSLLNAPRRTAAADASAALELLMVAGSAKEVLAGERTDGLRGQLLAAKAEVAEALAAARKLPPRFSTAVRAELGADLVAVHLRTACQVHPLVAQQWRGRFKDSVVFGVNSGFRPGWVHFSGRAPRGVNLIEFLARHRPDGADSGYGNGHDQAAGGSLRVPVWNGFAREIGFGEEFQVSEDEGR